MKKRNLFRRICRLGAWCALSGMSVLAACTDEAATGLPAEGAAIRFDVGLSETWESGGSAPAEASEAERADTLAGSAEVPIRSRSTASNISVTVIDGLPPRTKFAGPQTRAQKDNWDVNEFQTKFGENGFGVFGYVSDDDGNSWAPYITNAQIIDNGSSWEAADGQACNWPGKWRNCQIHFFAYAPYYDEEGNSDFYDSDNGPSMTIEGSSFTYTNALDAAYQKDFLVALPSQIYKSEENYSEAVELNFKPALTAVQFKLSFKDVQQDSNIPKSIEKIVLTGVSGTGTYDPEMKEWTGEGGSDEFTLTPTDNTDFGVDSGGEYNGTYFWPPDDMSTNPDFFLMIPQSVSEDMVLKVYYLDNTGNSRAVSIGGLKKDSGKTFPSVTWEAGKTVTYDISLVYEELNHIED